MKANFETGLKICSHCKRELPINNYQKDRSKLDGLCPRCKDCIKEYNQSPEGKEITTRIRKKFYQTEKGKLCQKRVTIKRSKDEKYKEAAKIRSKNYYESHKGEPKRVLRTINLNEFGEKVLNCTKCGRILSINSFHKDCHSTCGYDQWCKECRREYQKKRMKTEEFKIYNKEQQKKFKNTEAGKIYTKKYCAYKWKNDPVYRISRLLRSRLLKFLKGTVKSAHTEELLGCTWEELKAHLESQFTEGMSWDNYGDWHVDHIVPCAYFDPTDPVQQRICFNWRNLQPLWRKDNMEKRDTLPENYLGIIDEIKRQLHISGYIVDFDDL